MAPPAAPANIEATATSNSVTISWNTNRTVISYNVRFNGKVYSTSSTSITFSRLTPGTTYDYAVQARNIGGYGAYSAVQTIRTLVNKPAVPKNVSAVSSLSGVTITWDAVSGADNYDVQFDGQASRVAENQYKIYFDLQPGTEHTYCVRANNEGGSSAYSTLGRIKTKTSRQSGLPEGKWHKTYPDGRIPHLGLDPVNVLNGAFLWDYTFLKDYGIDNLHFTLMYDSQREDCSKILGRGWSHAFNYLLYKDNIYTYFSTPYGEVVPFRKEKDGSGFLPEEGIRSVYAMEQTEDGVYRVRKSDGTTYVFDSNLSPDKIMEGELVSYQFHTDADGRIVRIEGRHGGSLVLTYAGEHIVSVADLMGNTVRFSYDKDYLISATDCGANSIAFTYDDDGRLSEITDFSGKKYLTNWYDIYGKVIAQNIAGRGNSTASYDTVNRVTTFTDEAGNQTKYYYNEDCVITCVELGAHAISSSYNENGQVTQQTDLLKNTTQMLYDNLGRMTQVIYPDGTDEQVSYNDRSYPVRIVNRDGTESLYEYDSRNNLVSARDERGNQCTYVYDENDNLTSYTDKEGNVWTYVYDENHHLSSAADPEGNVYTYSHDKLGRLNSYTSPAGSTVSYQYSSTGNLLSVTDADGSILFEYDKNGNRTSVTDRNGNSQRLEYNEMGQVSLVTDFMGREYSFEYDERGNLVKETDPLDFHVSYTYDAMGNRISGTDKNGAVTSYTFNSVNQLTEVRDAAGGTVKYTYDTMGQVKTVTDPLEHQTAYTYDNAGRMTGMTDALGYNTAYTYDQTGNLLTRTDEDGAVTKYSYDKENRLLNIKTDAGITSFTYDKLGRVVSVTDAEEQKEQRAYDGDGNLTSATDKDGNQTTYTYHTSGRLAEKTDPDGGKTAYAYDSNGNCIKVTDAEGNIYSYEYDGNNRLVKVTNPLKQETAYAYDDRGQLISITDAKGGETAFAYDGNGNLTRKTNPLGGAKSYIYDVLNRLTQSTDEEGNTCTYTYDAAGNRTSYTDANGNKRTYTYDARNRLISVAGQDDGSLTYAYTGTGRIAKVTDQEGAETDYQYDSMGRLIRMSDGLENSLTFTYDSLGRMLTQTDANGNTTEFTYSPAGNLIKVKDAEEGETLYTYNGAGQVLTVTDPLGNTVSYEYDALGHVTMVTDPMDGKITLTYTADGQIATVTDPEGSVTEYAYDACGNLIQTVNPLGVSTLYEYDAMNNRIKECLSASGEQTCITLYQYDKKGRRIKEINPALEEKVYTYDGNGNLSSMTDEDTNKTTVSYDLNNKPVHMAYSDGKEASFRYNKRGELVEISDWNGITSMEHDEVGRLTKVTDPDSRTVCYSYDGAGNITGITYPDGSVVNYAYDKNNRMTEAADKDGKAVWYTYDGAGRVGSRCQPDSTVSYAYNAKGLPVQITHRLADTDFLKETLSYDKAGRMTGLERVGENLAIAGSMSYAYDGAGQLISYRRGQNTETYGYDLLGNRTFRKTNGADGAVYQYNALNQLVSLSENGKQYAYEYDKRGNLIQESLDGAAVRQYTYNAANRMTLGKNLETGEETRYDYNALYMRIKNVQTLAKQEPSEEFLTKETSYVPDYLSITNNDLMACEKDADAASTIFGQGHERLMQKTASGKVYFQPDLYGSILSVSDGQGQNLGYSEWDVWGDVEFHGQGNQPRPEGGAVPGFTSYIPDPVIGKHFAQARFYDPAHGRMLAPDPVKRGLNGYPYCGNDPVNYVDPTGEVANILAGGVLGGIMGGTFGFAGSAISQIVGGKEFDVREALGAGASGMVVGAVRGALVGSGAGLPVALVSDFTAGTVGSTLEQLITGGEADAGKSIAGGLTNAVSGAIYGNGPLGSLKEAFGRGAAAGAATSGINYLSEVFGGQDEDRRSGTLRGSLGLVPFGRVNDPRRGCMARDPFGGMTEEVSDYGYQYQMLRSERTVRKAPERFSLAEFGREVVTGFVMGGLASAAFYGAGRAVEAVKSSVRSGCGRDTFTIKSQIQRLKSKTPQQLLDDGWQDITDPRMAANNTSIDLYNPETGLKIRFDQRVEGASGFEAIDHYHVYNDHYTNKKVDFYFDIDGNTVGKGSKASHIVIGGRDGCK